MTYNVKSSKSKYIVSSKKARELRVMGIDPGKKYFAYATIKIKESVIVEANGELNHLLGEFESWEMDDCGFIDVPDIGNTDNFGYNLNLLHKSFSSFLDSVKPSLVIMERYVPTKFGVGNSEAMNLQIGAVCCGGYRVHLVRNTEWKRWIKKKIGDSDATGAMLRHSLTTTPHEADAVGQAIYGACRLLAM